MRGAGRHPCCCVNKSTRRQRRERQWRKERHQIDSPCLVNDFLHIYLLSGICTYPSHPHTYTSSHPHTYTSSHPHTSTYTYHATPSHPHTLTPAHIHVPIYHTHSPILTPSHLHIYLQCHPLSSSNIPTMPHPPILTPSHLHIYPHTPHRVGCF